MKVYSYKTPAGKIAPAKQTRKKFHLPKKRTVFTWLLRTISIGVVLAALMFAYYSRDLPDPNKLLDRQVAESTKIFGRNGEMLYEIHGEIKRTQVNLDQISDNLKKATIAIEDKDFYKHHGISFTGIGRAVLRLVINLDRSGGGGSTITQQLVKNAILGNKNPWDRKPREAIMSIAIESRFSKDDILKLYLNEIPYGRNAYGIEAASLTYLGKSAKDLSLAESAYLASLPQRPSYFDPFGPRREALDARKNYVLTRMREDGYITEQQEKEAKEQVVEFKKGKTAIIAPHFVLMVQDYLEEKYGEKTLQEGGLKVYTTLDTKLQKLAEDAVKAGAEKNAKSYKAYNAGLVAIDPKTGQVLALVGSKDYFAESEPAGCTPGKNCLFEPNVNVAISQRQPGSSFKPYVYVTSFKKDFGFAPASMLIDVTTNFGRFGDKEYIPQNYDGRQRGPVSIRQALAGSLNIPAVKTLALVGVENAVQTARDLGITSPMADCGLSLVLGGCEVKLIDHVAAMSVLANGGVKNEKTLIMKIEDAQGRVLEEFQNHPKNVLDPQAVYQLTSIMTDNDARSYIFGSRSPLVLPDRVVAAKTGTTQSWKDGWTMGFTPSLAVGVWAGNNDGTLMKTGADGVYVAAPIWNTFMKEALKDTPAENFSKPAGIQEVAVDSVSGKLPTNYSPATKLEVFADYNVPTTYDNVHVGVPYDTATDQPADSNTPADRIVYKTFTIFHSERPDNPDWENPVFAWAQSQGYVYPPGLGNWTNNPQGSGNGQIALSLIEPKDNSTISQLPFKVAIAAISPDPISKIEVSIDGQLVKTLTSSPYVFEVNKSYADGNHTLAVKATDAFGKTSDTSVNLNFAFTQPLALLEPAQDSLVLPPVSLRAESANQYSQINFYYQPEKGGSAMLIGSSDNVTALEGKYQYSLTWSAKDIPSGSYLIFARASNGTTTTKVKISLP